MIELSFIRLIKNGSALLAVQGLTILLPLVALPYLGRILGPTGFGLFAYAIGLASFLNSLVDYGFNWTATQEASHLRSDIPALSTLFADVISAKLFLFTVIFLIGSLLYIINVRFVPSYATWCALMLSPLGWALYPQWLFIGTERPARATIAVLSSRLISLTLIFSVIRTPSDALLAIVVQSATPAFSAAVSVPYIIHLLKRPGNFSEPLLNRILTQFRCGFPGFVSSLAVNAYTLLPILIVANLGGPVSAGQFGIADKVLVGTKSLLGVISQACMPRASYLAKHDPKRGIKFVKSVFFTLPVGFFMSAFLNFAGPQLIEILFGAQFSEAGRLIIIISPIPLLLNVSICTANLFMFNFGFRVQWSTTLSFAAASFLILSFVASLWAAPSTAVAASVVATECIVAVVSLWYFIYNSH